MLQLVQNAAPDDLCIVLLSGGGSALLPAPVPGVTLDDKIATTQALSSAGANIHELNVVRTALSEVKGGGLARACAARRMMTLVISDVVGDPLDIIASGPTILDSPQPGRAATSSTQVPSTGVCDIPRPAVEAIERGRPAARPISRPLDRQFVIGNNATAVAAASDRARGLGYQVVTLPPEPPTMRAEEVADQLVARLAQPVPIPARGTRCIVWGWRTDRRSRIDGRARTWWS